MWSDRDIGYIYFGLGCIYILPSFICLSVLTRPPLVYQSSYKMMCFISLMDMFNIAACCFFAGTYSIMGATYQNTPSMLAVGSISLAFWVSYCAMNIILAFDRLICFSSPKWSSILFSGRRAFYWIGLAVLAGVQMLIEFDGKQLYHYDSSIGGWRFELLPLGTKNYRHMFINVGTFTLLVLLYSSMVVIICKKGTKDKFQTQVALQSAAICGFAMGADIFCIIVQNIEEPSVAMCYGANFAWQIAHGGTEYAVLIMNRSIREATLRYIYRLLGICGIKMSTSTVATISTHATLN
ncbi:hypothetical protein QR680_015882 [Steinernema hermaphroditum]|uniref:Serpentine receptor class gamma n=1 Tax=Steinernema hermaphroditum TaxID=289476 RepID=A0AA39LL00_9BILA|nr:hypothetical protein QR680_015882 [Steinernema hermaphroditum]